VAATSVYLHFDSIEALTLATVNHLFTELISRQDALTETSPRERVLAGAMVYCEFGLAAPGHYQLMFATRCRCPRTRPSTSPAGRRSSS
jgi:AcrR family transcriptional regulator